jgi:pimeloyl-ACP methyl ester carboxylesterase/membrane protein DedA with SNARE-associated domain
MSWRRKAVLAYLALLAICAVVRWWRPADDLAIPAGMSAVTLPAFDGWRPLPDAKPVRLAWREWPPPAGTTASDVPLVLIHGAPGSHADFERLAPLLATNRRVLAPDLPGFGASAAAVPDYSIAAQASYLDAWLAEQGIPRADLLGFSLGGAIAVTLADRDPARVASVTLLSATGVEELELLGDYALNHLIHGVQLSLARSVHRGVPHLGGLDRRAFNVAYARSFYDSDQRPLRDAFGRLPMPTLILHGKDDALVDGATAGEHHRLVPQSELAMLDGDHYLLTDQPVEVAAAVDGFLDRVAVGQTLTRATASPARLAEAAVAFDPRALPPLGGLGLLVVMVILAVATHVSEDLACIAGGLLVAQGRLGFWPATIACFLGIYVGDLGLFALGRVFGRRVLQLPPLRWWLSEESLAQSSAWFRERGTAVILISRFVPGTRLPTYVAAGILHTPFWRFAAVFAVASALWTPGIVGLAWWVGAALIGRLAWAQEHALALFALVVVVVVLVRSVVIPLFSWGGRRRLLGRVRRLTHWEFWPPWLFYPPILLYVLGLAIKHRGLTVFTAANPGIPTGGFIGESKADILRALAGADAWLPRWDLLPAPAAPHHHGPEGDAEREYDAEQRAARVESFRLSHQLDFPLVLKPDAGQRGSGVAVVRDGGEVLTYLRHTHVATIVQEYVPGVELGIFYIRHPEAATGRIFSVTDKQLPSVVGDGEASIETLILRDPRAIAMADFYLEHQGERRWRVPAAGERVPLVELGTHCRGAIFLDGGAVVTPELAATIDRISKTFTGFHFGRYDVRATSLAALQRGELKVIELNGVTAEATSIYDPRHTLREAYATLREQWRLAFEIGAWHRDRGVRPSSAPSLIRDSLAYRRAQKSHPLPPSPPTPEIAA